MRTEGLNEAPASQPHRPARGFKVARDVDPPRARRLQVNRVEDYTPWMLPTIATRRLGRTELQISELVFGGGFVGGLLVLAEDDAKREALRRYLSAGGNWIDTAALYGGGRSEAAIGWLLQELEPAARPYVSTKVGVVSPTVDGGAAGSIASQIEAGFAESSERLQLESFTLFQLHSQIVTSEDTVGDYSTALTVEEILGPGGAENAFSEPLCTKNRSFYQDRHRKHGTNIGSVENQRRCLQGWPTRSMTSRRAA